MKKTKIVVSFVSLALGMAGFIFCSINPEAEAFLLRYAIAASVIFAGLFLAGIITLHSTTGSDDETVCNVGEVFSLPCMYFGLMGIFLILVRMGVGRILATEDMEQITIEPKLFVVAGGAAAIIVALFLLFILCRTAKEDGFGVFATVVSIGIVLAIAGAGAVSEMNRKLDAGVVDFAESATATVGVEAESEAAYGTDL